MSIIARVQAKPLWAGRRLQRFRLLLVTIILGLLGGLIYALHSSTGLPVPRSSASALSPGEVSQILLRNGVGAEGVAIDGLYAPPWYFEWNGRQPPTADKPVLVFYLFETIHEGNLTANPPAALLEIDGRRLGPLNETVLSEAAHHRVSQVLFPAMIEDRTPLLTENTRHIALLLPVDGVVSEDGTLSWDLPLPYGAGAIGSTASPVGHQGMTVPSFVAILGGILAALSPCLMQLTVYYAATLAGSSAEVATSTAAMANARAGIIKTALFFVVGFTIVYTMGGALAGYIGESLQRLGSYSQWLRPVAIISGVLILALAVRTAARARVPLVCRLPLVRIKPGQKTGFVGSVLMGLSFAVGCLSCFSATVLTALLLYAGATGSPLMGALLMLVFSLGIGLVFLLAALLMVQALPWLTFLRKAQPAIGLASALIMGGFGLLMITDSFHLVSGFLSALFGLK